MDILTSTKSTRTIARVNITIKIFYNQEKKCSLTLEQPLRTMSSPLHVSLLPQGLQKFVAFHRHLVSVVAEESEETSCKFS